VRRLRILMDIGNTGVRVTYAKSRLFLVHRPLSVTLRNMATRRIK
jgi:hypothetical protein